MGTDQIEIECVEQLLGKEHPYRRLKGLLDFTRITKSVKVTGNGVGAVGFGKLRLISA